MRISQNEYKVWLVSIKTIFDINKYNDINIQNHKREKNITVCEEATI